VSVVPHHKNLTKNPTLKVNFAPDNSENTDLDEQFAYRQTQEVKPDLEILKQMSPKDTQKISADQFIALSSNRDSSLSVFTDLVRKHWQAENGGDDKALEDVLRDAEKTLEQTRKHYKRLLRKWQHMPNAHLQDTLQKVSFWATFKRMSAGDRALLFIEGMILPPLFAVGAISITSVLIDAFYLFAEKPMLAVILSATPAILTAGITSIIRSLEDESHRKKAIFSIGGVGIGAGLFWGVNLLELINGNNIDLSNIDLLENSIGSEGAKGMMSMLQVGIEISFGTVLVNSILNIFDKYFRPEYVENKHKKQEERRLQRYQQEHIDPLVRYTNDIRILLNKRKAKLDAFITEETVRFRHFLRTIQENPKD